MTVTTGPTQPNPSHHVKLTDGTDTVGLVLVDAYGRPDARGFQNNPLGQPIKIMQGQSTYSDSAPPWDNIEMKDFGGGMGKRDFDNDKSGYYWGLRAYTHDGKFMIGPEPVWTGGLYRYWPYSFDGYVWHELNATNTKLAVQFTTTSTTEITYIHIVAKGDVTQLIASIRADDAGSPGALVGSSSISNFFPAPTDTDEYVLTINTGALTNATAYWLLIDGSGITPSRTPARILCASFVNLADDVKKYVAATSTWTAIGTYRPFHVLGKRYTDNRFHFFELKGAQFAAIQFDDGTTSSLHINGDQGVIKAGGSATDVTLDSGFATWAADEAIGSVMIIMAGAGSTQPRNFRVIEDNNATSSGDTLFKFTNDPWDVAPDATSEVAIVASNKWTGITPNFSGESPTNQWTNKQVTDVLVANQAAYFAHGDDNAMSRLRVYNSTGTWTAEWTLEAATSKYTYLGINTDPRGAYIWGAKGGYPAKIAKAPAVDCSGTSAAADLVFDTEMAVGSLGDRITNLVVYGEDYGQLHVLKENGLFRLNVASDNTDYVTEIPITGLPPTKDWRNGHAAVVHDYGLFLSWHDTIMRYYRNNIDNVGLNNRDTVTPKDYRGVITALTSYPGMLIAAIDAGDSGYSTVNAWNGTGWCNLFTAPIKGYRIQSIYIQPIPGDNVDRLWINCADTNLWIPISVNPYEHPTSTYNSYNQAWDATIQMGMMFAGRKMLPKYWSEMQFHVYNDEYKEVVSVQDTHHVGLYDHALNTLYGYDPAEVSVSSSDEIAIDYALPYIKPKITIRGAMPASYFALDALIFKAIVFDKTRRSNVLTVRIADRDKDLGGDYDDYMTADAKYNKLLAWEGSSKLTMTSSVGVMDNKSVFLTIGGIRLLSIERDDMTTTYLAQIVVYET